jgi:hypothetical protein
MTSLADQDERRLGGAASLLVRQKRDHVRLDGLLTGLTGLAADRQDAQLRRIYRMVFRHAFAEEAVLWPVLRRVLPDGDALTLQVEQEHQEVNELVTALEGMPADAPDRPATVARWVAVLRADVRDEEDALLPRLQVAVPVRRSRVLGVLWESVRRVAPSRAHPVVSRRPPGNVPAAVPLSVVDALRDVVDLTLHHRPPVGAAALRSISRGLERGAHRIQRLPLLRRGEHRSASVR